MPTPQFTPGAALFPITLTSPAFQGVNLEASGSILGREWATILDNAVFDETGRPASRNGFQTLTLTPASGIVMRILACGIYQHVHGGPTGIYHRLSSH